MGIELDVVLVVSAFKKVLQFSISRNGKLLVLSQNGCKESNAVQMGNICFGLQQTRSKGSYIIYLCHLIPLSYQRSSDMVAREGQRVMSDFTLIIKVKVLFDPDIPCPPNFRKNEKILSR